MADQNGSGDEAVVQETIVAVEAEPSSLNGFGAPSEDPLAARPELLLGAAILGGVLLAGLVSRVGR